MKNDGVNLQERIFELYKQFRDLPFPRLGHDIGNFVLFDSQVAGGVDSYLHGKPVHEASLAPPDDDTYQDILALREKTELTEEERSFLGYYEVLEELQSAVRQAVNCEALTCEEV
jgi:hypothetical protein